MEPADFEKLVNLYDRFANALDFDSADAREAEGEFYSLLEEEFEKERAEHPKLEFGAFRRGVVSRCKKRIATGQWALEDAGAEQACAFPSGFASDALSRVRKVKWKANGSGLAIQQLTPRSHGFPRGVALIRHRFD